MKRGRILRKQRGATCTVLLIAANAAVFLLLSLKGESEDAVFMLEHGAMFAPYIIERHEYYRFFTSQFLHFGIDHLMNNMVMLGALGWNLEPYIGSIKFLFIYLLSGLAGNVLSFFAHLGIGVVSAGASGAILGLMGSLVAVVIKNHGRLQRLSKARIIFMVVLSLYFGFRTVGIDNAAHVGGLIAGFLSTLILYRKPYRKRRTYV